MTIDIGHVEANIRRFHKTTTLLASKASGIPEDELQMYPVIVTREPEVWAVTFTTKQPDSDFYAPYIVNASFCLEMLLKLIILRETGEWTKGHNLIRLYEKISTTSKKTINARFKKLHKESPAYGEVSKILKKRASIEVNWNVASLLSLSSTAFENWRYAFDKTIKKSCFIGYGEIYTALYELERSLSANK